jgi:hypothetical protein
MKDLEGRLEAEALAGPMVELADVGLKLLLGDLAQVGAFGQVLA